MEEAFAQRQIAEMARRRTELQSIVAHDAKIAASIQECKRAAATIAQQLASLASTAPTAAAKFLGVDLITDDLGSPQRNANGLPTGYTKYLIVKIEDPGLANLIRNWEAKTVASCNRAR